MPDNCYSLHKIVDHNFVDQSNLIDYLVAFGRVLQNLVAFGRIWSHLVAIIAPYLNTPREQFNHLIDKTFNSHQEYTIATSLLAPARGTLNRANCLIFSG